MAKSLLSVGQRAAKLTAIKLWEWFYPERTRIWVDWFKWGQGQAADFFLNLQLWKLVILKSFILQTLYLQYWKIYTFQKSVSKQQQTQQQWLDWENQKVIYIFSLDFPCQIDLIYKGVIK